MIDLNKLFNDALSAAISNAIAPTIATLSERMTDIEAAVTTLQEQGPANLSEEVVKSIVDAIGRDDALAERLTKLVAESDTFGDAVCDSIESNPQRVADAIEENLNSDDAPSKTKLREMIGDVIDAGNFEVSFNR